MRKKHMAMVFGLVVIGIFLSLSAAPAVEAQIPADRPGRMKWFYDNFDADDRRKVRMAFDYCIPRQQIVEGLHQGYAFSTPTSINKQIDGYYNASITARAYNTTKALELLTEVFGYEYNASQAPYFDMVLLAPTTNAARTQWAALISQAFSEVGINSEVKYRTWSVLIPRIFTNPAGDGYDFAHGGHDAYFIGWNASPDIDQSSQHSGKYFVPNGDNGGFLNDSAVNDMWDRAVYSPDRQDRIDAVMEWQTWYYNNVPASIMRQETMLFAFAPEISGFDVLLQGYYFQNMTHSNPAVTEVTYTIPGEFDDYNPLISNSYYDFCALSNCHYSLSSRRGVYNISHPVPTPITEYWNVSADQLTWDVKLTEGLFFSNGNKFNASDVVFSYQAPFDENIGSSSRATVLTVFQNASNIVAVDEYHVRFTLPEFYPFMSSIGLGLSILDKEEMEGYNINASEWSTHASNTEYTPAGLGPYIMTDIDPTGYGCKLIPNPYHIGYEDAAAVGGGIYWQNATLNVSLDIEKSPFTAWTNLKNDAIHGIDANTGLQALASDIIASPDGVLVTVLEYGWQELVYNHFSPIWGNNPTDPTELYPDDYVVETTEVVISTVISGTTYYETVIQTVVQSPGFGVLVFLGGSISLAYLFRKKRR